VQVYKGTGLLMELSSPNASTMVSQLETSQSSPYKLFACFHAQVNQLIKFELTQAIQVRVHRVKSKAQSLSSKAAGGRLEPLFGFKADAKHGGTSRQIPVPVLLTSKPDCANCCLFIQPPGPVPFRHFIPIMWGSIEPRPKTYNDRSVVHNHQRCRTDVAG
jgi:hypothetical protein